MMSEQGAVSRTTFVHQSVLASLSVFLPTFNAQAAKYGSFGSDSPEVLDPSKAVVDTALLSSASVQKAFQSLASYRDTVLSMKSTLTADRQANLAPTIQSKLDFVALRTDLNTVNSVFDEDTQRGTDRIIRIILQDITELETANRQKEGIVRSDRRVETMMAKLNKLEQAFSDYLAFAK
jgi:hypothetical protein